MKNSKGFLSAIALAVAVSAISLISTDFSPKSLQTNVPGYSIPVDTNYSSFGCKSPGSWSNTVWCQAYGSTYELHVTEANKHANVIVMFKRSGTVSGGFGLPYGSDYYVVGDYGSSAVGKNGQTYNKDSFVKCPSGATMQYHLRSHHLYSPSLGEGFYDGEGHYWCELNSAAVDPEKLDGKPAGVQLPDSEDISRDKLYPIFFPGGTVKYKKIDDAASFYKCSNGYEGPYEPGVNQYLNTYHVKESWKKPYYRCLTADGSGFENAVSDGSMADFTASTGPTNISASMFGLNDAKNCSADYTTCQPSCAAGDSTCGGAGTYVTSGAFCASNTYIFQTTDYNTRYCAASPTTGIYAPPTIYSATITHVNYATSGDTVSAAVGGTITIIPGVKSYHPWIEIKNTGNTSDTYTFSHTNTSSDSNVSAGKIKDCVYTVNDAPVTSVIIAAGASQKVRLQCNVEDVDPNGVVLTQSLIVGSQGKWQKLGPYTYNITTKKQAQCALNIQLNDNKTSYTQGDMVNYSYYCSPTGTTAATTYVYVVKSDGSSTLYTSGTNSSAITLGFSTSNLTAGSYTLKVCADSACTLNSASIPFTVVAASTPPTIGQPTLNGTIFKDGQYVDPATSVLRNCVSPNYWMKEGPTSSGARGFHCMPNMPNYTLTSDHYPPTPCTGTLWASSTAADSFYVDYCATSKDSTPPPPTPVSCNYDGVCNNGETASTCPADCSYTPPSTCKLGQKDCDPNLSCDLGKRCYVGGKLSCLDWDATCGGNTCAPVGTSQYYPGCKEAGSITDRVGDDFPGYCNDSMSCYSKDEKKRHCQPMSTGMMPAFSSTCTNPEFPKVCSPLDTSCLDIGESGTSGYCGSGGKECYADGSTSFTCIAENEECKGSVCPTNPGDPRYLGCTAEGPGPENGWCAINNSVLFFKQSKEGGIYCLKNPNPTDMYFWETAAPPAGYGRCRFEEANNGCIDKLNVPVKKVSGKGYWCAVGMRQDDEANAMVTCVSGRDYKPPRDTEPPIKVCQDVMSVAYNPSTLECRSFSNSCLSDGWVPLGVNQICESGKVIELSDVTDDKSLIQIIDKKLSFLDTIRYSLKELPVSLSETTALRELVEKGTAALKDLRAKLPAKTVKARGDISAELERVNKNIIADIEDKWAKVQAYIDFAHLRDEIFGRLPDLKHEAGACDQSTDYCKYINDVIPTLESLLGAAEGQTGNVYEQLVTDIRTTWDKFQKRMLDERGGHRDTFFANQVQKLLNDREKIRDFIKDRAIEDTKIVRLFSEFDIKVTYLQNMISAMDGILGSPKQILEKAFQLKALLEGYLATYGYEVTEVRSWEDLMPFVQEEVKKQLELLFPKIEQTVRVLMDEALQELALNMVKIIEELKPEIQEAVSQGISNLSIELNERRKEILDEVIAAKNEIVKSLGDLEEVVAARLGTFTANRYRTDVIEVVAPVVWCGDYAATIESRINNAGLAIENGDSVDFGELHTFVTDAMADNIIECRRIGASRFYMPIESWYWPYVEESAEKGCIKGYSDASDTATGYFGEADPTLRIEAVKMVSCIFGVAQGAATTDRGDVPPWGVPYFNGLKVVAPDFDWSLPMDQVITRFEIAELVVRTMLALDKGNVVAEADKVELVEDFTDASQVAAHKYALAVETLVDLGVFKGHADGRFGGNDFTFRSEFAAILDRINDLIVEMYGIGGRDDVAIGTPPGN